MKEINIDGIVLKYGTDWDGRYEPAGRVTHFYHPIKTKTVEYRYFSFWKKTKIVPIYLFTISYDIDSIDVNPIINNRTKDIKSKMPIEIMRDIKISSII